MYRNFKLVGDLGTILVPDNFSQKNWLLNFYEEVKEFFYFFDRNINDKNFFNSSYILVPGEKFEVLIYIKITSGIITHKEALDFISSHKGFSLLGAQGLSIVCLQRMDDLSKGFKYLSLDKRNSLWKDNFFKRKVRIPCLVTYKDKGPSFLGVPIEEGIHKYDCLVVFVKKDL